MFMQTLLDNAKADKDIIFITGDLGYGVVEEFQKEIPNQFINAGVSEQAMMGIAAGIASTGKRVFVYSIGNFPTLRCLEQIRNDVCLMNNSVVVVSVGAGYSYGSQGYTHHALEDIAVMRALPNMSVYVPCDSIESKAITNFLCKDKSPSYLRLGKSGEPILHSAELSINNNKIIELKNGADGLILFVGPIGNQALLAAKKLESIGINVAVASAPVLSNLDEDYLIKSAQSGPIVTVEEHSFRGGFGSAVLEKLNSLGISYKLKIVASKQNNLSEIGSQAYLQKANGLDHESITETFLSLRANQKK
jgi:transketolase